VAKVIRITASAALREIEAASALVALDFQALRGPPAEFK